MIVPMKITALLCLASDTDATLETLRELGVLHVTNVNEPKSVELESIARQLQQTKAALSVLEGEAAEAMARKSALPAQTGGANDSHVPTEAESEEMVERIHTLTRLRKEFSERIAALKEERAIIAPYGHFDPEIIDALAHKGVKVKLYQIGGKKPPEPPDGTWIFPVSRDPVGQYFAMVGMGGDFEVAACEFIPHHRPLSIVEDDLKQAETDLGHMHREMEKFTASSLHLKAHLRTLEGQESFLNVRNGMGDGGSKVAYLRGFCPEDLVHALTKAAKHNGWGLLVDDPSPDDSVPTLVRNPAWVRPVKSLLDLIDVLPGYKEVDINWIFLIAFSLFFAMLVGDAGYGLVFFALTALARWKFKKAPAEPFRLLYLLSICTILWGMVTANYFGSAPGILKKAAIPWLADEKNFMELCFLIGAVHLTIAHAWNVIRMINSTRALAQIGWILLTWAMFLGARNLVLGYDLHPLFRFLFIIGIVLVPLFMVPLKHLKTEWQNFCTLPFDVINNFVDVVSYIRLFAVGSASLAVATAFNEMAIGNGINSVLAGLMAALILFLGHALNIVLALMSVLVHGIRLNTLEFSSHIGLEWAGFKYRPFATNED